VIFQLLAWLTEESSQTMNCVIKQNGGSVVSDHVGLGCHEEKKHIVADQELL